MRAVVLLIVANVSTSSPLWAAEPLLFESDATLELTIHGPLKNLTRSRSAAAGVAGRIELENGASIPIRCTRFGISRLRECGMPSLKIDFDADEVRGTIFDGHHSLRLVTPCHMGGGFDRYILLEYLVYKSYLVIADPALRVRLVSCRFRDDERSDLEHTALAFFVEDIGATAERHGKAWLDATSQLISDLDPEQVTVLALFQFMVGNTDWSVLAGAEGERCCHNVAALGAESARYNTLLPFDFDYAGLVNAPYAMPDESLGIRSVTERLYRGFCDHNEELPQAIAVFNDRRPLLEELFNVDGLPYPKTRKRALKYIERFYDTINDPRKVERLLVRDCR